MVNYSNHKMKGMITEIQDLEHLNAKNVSIEHGFAVNQGGIKAFARKDGIFTHLYNSAARIKEDKPFKV